MNLSIKNVPDDVVGRLRQRAERNHRSLQGELLTIIEDAAREASSIEASSIEASSIEAKPFDAVGLLADIRALGLKTPSESAQMIREDRDR